VEEFRVDDDTQHEPAEAQRLREVRARRTTVQKQALRRGRDWSLIGAAVLALSSIQLAFMAWRAFDTGDAARGWVMGGLIVIALVAAGLLFRRHRRLALLVRETK
jgi:hypothetical protein